MSDLMRSLPARLRVGAWIACVLLANCTAMSRTETDSSVGMNGGFEVERSGLPVNWIVYAPDTVPNSDFDLIVDTADVHAGTRSLKFVVRDCSGVGGWRSPGFCNEFAAVPGETYHVGFWVKSEGATFMAHVGGVTPKTGEYEMIVRATDDSGEWKYYGHDYTLPEKYDTLRFQFNVLSPGTIWIDEVTISGID